MSPHRLAAFVAERAREATAFDGFVSARVLECAEWASLTFTGHRHRLCLRMAGRGMSAVGAAADLLARLDDLDLSPPGLLVADVALVSECRHDDGMVDLELELLTVDDA